MLDPTTTPPFAFQEGCLLLIDKPKGWTSFDVVNKVRWAIRKHLGIKKIKVGHAGTLDPMATGMLNICTGKWTKRLAELNNYVPVEVLSGALTPESVCHFRKKKTLCGMRL